MKLASVSRGNLPRVVLSLTVATSGLLAKPSSGSAEIITNPVSAVVSYQYPEDLSSEVLTNGGATAPLVSYQYPEDLSGVLLTGGQIMSPIISYQYQENLASDLLTSGGVMSPLVSYQYLEWPGNNVLQLLSSLPVSYFYQSGTTTNPPPSDTTPPSLAISAPTDFEIFTNAATTISGTASDASGIMSVTIGGVNASLVATNWSSAFNLALGTNTITVIATDSSVNLNTTTQTVHAVLLPPQAGDTTPPSLVVLSPVNYQIFTNASITVSGTAQDASGINGVSVSGSSASLVGTNWARAYTLATGTNVLTVIAVDSSSNLNATTQTVHAVLLPAPPADTTPPTLVVITPTNYQIFTNSGVSVTGTANDASGIKGVTVNGTAASVLGTNWARAFALATGTNTLTVVATDNSANLNATTQTVHAVLSPPPPADTTPPSLVILSPANDQVFTNAAIVVSGTASDASGIGGVMVNGLAASLINSNWSRTFTLATGTNVLSVIAVDRSANLNTATQSVHAVFEFVPAATNHPPQIIAGPTVTNAVLQVDNVAVVWPGETNVFSVSATDADGDSLNYLWDFGDHTSSGAPSMARTATHAYDATNCGPFSASAVVSDGITNTTGSLTVAVPCALGTNTLSMSLKLNFKRSSADSASLTGILDLPDSFNPTGRKLTLDIGGTIIPFDALSVKWKSINQWGTCRLSSKKGLWTIKAKLKGGDWHGDWAVYLLTNESIPKPGRSVTVPVIVVVGDEAFLAEKRLVYTATAGKSGSAK